MTGERRSNAGVRVRRLLALVPWLAANDGPTVAAVCDRFRISEEELRRDLELLSSSVGVPPYTPDALFHISVERGRVFANLTPTFDRPLRLTPEEGIALVVAGRALDEVEGAEPDGPLARALGKLAGVLGIDPDEAVDVDLGTAAVPLLAVLRTAVAEGRRVELSHYSAGRDELLTRVVDPWLVAHDAGSWYLVGFDRLRGEQRTFRIDRVLAAVPLDAAAKPAPAGLRPEFNAGEDVPRVRLRLAPSARWVVETHPVEDVAEVGGAIEATVAVAGLAWFERLLLRLGPDAEVLDAPPELAGVRAAAARKVLARYES